MRLILLISALCGLAAAQTKQLVYEDADRLATAPENATDAETPAPSPIWHGPDWLPMIGGTELEDVVYPQAVPLKQDGQLVNGDDNFDCFAVIAGKGEGRVIFTSGFCMVAGYISKKYASARDIKITRHPQIGGTAVRTTRPFNIDSYTYDHFDRLNESIYYPGDLILDKKRFQNLVQGGNITTPAIVLGSSPYKAAVVSIDQRNCPDWYRSVALPYWPELMPEGVFCVSNATEQITAHVANGIKRSIEPGLPCLDSLGSPVLVGTNFSEVLGVVIRSTCDFKISPDLDVPKFALAASLAHGLEWENIVLPSRNPFLHQRGRTTLDTRPLEVSPVHPYVGDTVSRMAISKVLFWNAALFWAFRR